MENHQSIVFKFFNRIRVHERQNRGTDLMKRPSIMRFGSSPAALTIVKKYIPTSYTERDNLILK
jgi:hypothetical protein